MSRTLLQQTYAQTQARLAADERKALTAAGVPSALALCALRLLEALEADDPDDAPVVLDQLVGAEHRKVLRRAQRDGLREALNALESDAALRAACQALLDALDGGGAGQRAQGVRLDMRVGDGASVSNSPQTYVGGHYTSVGRVDSSTGLAVGPGAQSNVTINHAPPVDTRAERQERALRSYLARVAEVCSALPLGQLDPTDAAQRPMQLAQVYIGLHTTSHVAVSKDEGPRQKRNAPTERGSETRPLTALEAVCARPDRGGNAPAGRPQATNRLTLLGPPGSGKSTFVSHLALCLAGATLSERTDQIEHRDAWLARLPDWTLGALLPVTVVLRDFAAWPLLGKAPKGSTQLLLDFIAHTLADANCADALEPITTALHDGRAILLLDGFDEVVGTEVLRRVGESIADAALTWGRSPLLVTCRVLDYQAEPLRQLPGFGVEMLAELTNEQIEQFVRDWYAELAASGRRTPPQATDDARALGGAVSAQEELQNLARLPLLLTVMALVHTNRGKLPDTRALLYAECIDLLLLRWRQSGKEPDLLTRIGLSQFRSGDLLKLMAHLGYTAHTQAERLAGEEGPADLSEQDVIGLLAEGFAQYDAPRRYELAGVVLEALASGNGLLLKRGPGVYSFPHRTFQEFLAGYHLSGQRDYLSRCRGHAAQPHWHEALLLMAGYQVHATPSPEPTILLAEKLLADGPQQAALAGELLVLVGSERAAQYDPALVAKNGLWPHARRVLLELATTGTPPAAPAPLRVRAGLAAGLLCYGPLARLCVPNATVALPDARLPLALVGLGYEQHPEWRRALSNYWCHLNAGPFFSGDDRKNTLLRQVRLPYPFAIGRYPVTNAEFVRFVADGGYAEQRWWTEEGWMFLQRGENEPVTGPRLFDHLRYNGPTQPVVGVSWYEAVAYCAWLTAHGHAAGWLLEGDELRLPTSLECERAARHTDTRRYPWGTSPPDAERANYRDSGVNRPSPIGCFPGGTAMCGAQDMVGNVREWLATPYAAEKQVQLAKDFTLREDVLLSYSGWGDKEEDLCCGARDWYGPFYRYVDRSFRLVCSRRSSE